MKKNNIKQTWLRFTDEGSEGEWRDKLTNRTVDFDSIPWRVASEPTGFIAENCSGIFRNKAELTFIFDKIVLFRTDK